MVNSIGLSLIAAALFGAAVHWVPEEAKATAAAAPFWQLQGASPAAGETDAVASLRAVARHEGGEPVLAAR